MTLRQDRKFGSVRRFGQGDRSARPRVAMKIMRSVRPAITGTDVTSEIGEEDVREPFFRDRDVPGA